MISGVNDLVTGGIAVAGIKASEYIISKFSGKKTAQVIKEVAPFVEHEAQALFSSPVAKTVEAKLHLELDHQISELKKSSLAQWSQAAIAGADKLYEELSPSEQAAAISFVKSHVPTVVEATEKEIAGALKAAPELGKLFAGDATFAKAQELTQLLTSANAAPAQPEQTSLVGDGQPETAAVS